jgi:hypothetical protein
VPDEDPRAPVQKLSCGGLVRRDRHGLEHPLVASDLASAASAPNSTSRDPGQVTRSPDTSTTARPPEFASAADTARRPPGGPLRQLTDTANTHPSGRGEPAARQYR